MNSFATKNLSKNIIARLAVFCMVYEVNLIILQIVVSSSNSKSSNLGALDINWVSKVKRDFRSLSFWGYKFIFYS